MFGAKPQNYSKLSMRELIDNNIVFGKNKLEMKFFVHQIMKRSSVVFLNSSITKLFSILAVVQIGVEFKWNFDDADAKQLLFDVTLYNLCY